MQMNALGRNGFPEPQLELLPPRRRFALIVGLAALSWAGLIVGALESF